MCGGDTTKWVGKCSNDQVTMLQLYIHVYVYNNSLGLQISFFHSTYHDAYVPETILKELCTEAAVKFANEEEARSVNLYVL